MPACPTWPRAGRGPGCGYGGGETRDRSQRPDPDRGQAAAEYATGSQRADRAASLLPVRQRPPGAGHVPVPRGANERGPRSRPGGGGPQCHGVRHSQRRRRVRQRAALPGPGRADPSSDRGRPGRHGPTCPRGPPTGPAAAWAPERQLPAALGCLAGAPPPAIRPRFPRPDGPAPPRRGRGRGRTDPNRPTGRHCSTRRQAGPGGSAAPAGWPGSPRSPRPDSAKSGASPTPRPTSPSSAIRMRPTSGRACPRSSPPTVPEPGLL